LKPGLGRELEDDPASPPARGRGLKHHGISCPLAEIESPPARGRGLKPARTSNLSPILKSPPARGRGLKHPPARPGDTTGGRPPRGGVD